MLIQRLLKCFAARDLEPCAPLPLAWSLDVLKDAIQARREVVAFHGKEWLVFCPHDLRQLDGEPEVLAHLVGGHAYHADEVNCSRWVWLPVAELWGVEARGAGRATSHGAPLHGPLPARGGRGG